MDDVEDFDVHFTGNVDFLEKLLDILDDRIISKILSLCKNLPLIFNTIIKLTPAPELDLRDDHSLLTKFIRICLKYLYPPSLILNDLTFESVMNIKIPDPINIMCYYLDRTIWKHPKSHIIAVTSILTLRGICPKLVVSSFTLAKEVMKIAGISSISEIDILEDVSIIIRSTTGDIHVCQKCKMWICDDCEKSSSPNFSNISPDSPRNSCIRYSSSSNDIGNDTTAKKSKSFSPRKTGTFSPKSFFYTSMRDSPRSYKHRKKSYPQDTKSKNLRSDQISMYDIFCQNIIHKGYKKSVGKNISEFYHPIKIFKYEIIELMEKFKFFLDTEENYIRYGNILRKIIEENDFCLDRNHFLYWDSQFDETERKELYKNIYCEVIVTDDEDTIDEDTIDEDTIGEETSSNGEDIIGNLDERKIKWRELYYTSP